MTQLLSKTVVKPVLVKKCPSQNLHADASLIKSDNQKSATQHIQANKNIIMIHRTTFASLGLAAMAFAQGDEKRLAICACDAVHKCLDLPLVIARTDFRLCALASEGYEIVSLDTLELEHEDSTKAIVPSDDGLVPTCQAQVCSVEATVPSTWTHDLVVHGSAKLQVTGGRRASAEDVVFELSLNLEPSDEPLEEDEAANELEKETDTDSDEEEIQVGKEHFKGLFILSGLAVVIQSVYGILSYRCKRARAGLPGCEI